MFVGTRTTLNIHSPNHYWEVLKWNRQFSSTKPTIFSFFHFTSHGPRKSAIPTNLCYSLKLFNWIPGTFLVGQTVSLWYLLDTINCGSPAPPTPSPQLSTIANSCAGVAQNRNRHRESPEFCITFIVMRWLFPEQWQKPNPTSLSVVGRLPMLILSWCRATVWLASDNINWSFVGF